MSRVTRSSSEYQMHTPSANADAGTHMRARTLDVRFHPTPEIGPPDWNCRLSLFREKGRRAVRERIGGTGEGRGTGRERVPGLLVVLAHPSKASLRRREDEDTRVPPLVSHVTGDATVCNRRSCATGLIWDAFEVRRIFAPAHGDLNRMRREMGFFNLRFAFPVSFLRVRIYFTGYHVAE